MAKSFYILDGHYQVYRAFFAPFRELTSPTGEPTRATHVFFQMLFGLLRNRRPDYLAMVMDVGDETTFRRDLDESYKAHRDPAPEALHIQADRIVEAVKALGIPVFVLPGFEADDLMATIAHILRDQDTEIFLASKDKDLEQLITDRVFLYDASKGETLGASELMEKKGYTPQQAVEIQTLTGDSTDNIPGVHGVGPKTALKLIKEHGTAHRVLEHTDKLTPKLAANLQAFKDKIELTRTLVTLRKDAPFEFDLEQCATDRLTFAPLKPIFEQLGFTRLKDQLMEFVGEAEGQGQTETPIAKPLAELGEYELIDTPERFKSFVGDLAKTKCFAFDTETTGLNPVAADLVGLSFCWESAKAYYVPVRALMGRTLSMDLVVSGLKPIFEQVNIAKVGQNLKFDMLMLRQVGINTKGAAFDTRIAHFLLDPLARSHSLDGMSRSLLGHEMIPITDLIGKGKNQITIDQVDTARVGEYAAEDADFTWRLYEHLAPRMAGNPVEKLFHEVEMPLVEVLTEMEHNGIALNSPLLAGLGESMGDRMIELTREIHREAGHSFNVDSTKQLAVVLFDEQGLEVIKKTKTGRSTDRDTLAALKERTEHPIPTLVLEYRELAKLKSTYIDTLPRMVCQRTKRIHASFDQTGAVTGRLSSSGPNLQNIPIRTETGRRIREAIVVGEADHTLLTADYSQVELRLLAHFCKDEALVHAFIEGHDIHQAVAAQVNDVALEEVTSTQRSAAKAVNFGIIYGQSAFGLSKSLGISMGEAKAFIDAYFQRYPGIRTFIDHCIEQAKDLGYAETILGRRRPVPELQSRNRQQVQFGERIAVNTVVQGSAADLIKKAMISIHQAYLHGEHRAKMLIQVHDELVFEVPCAELEPTTALIRNHMEHAIDLNVPVVVDIGTGTNWAGSK